jgi:hypothetical protein
LALLKTRNCPGEKHAFSIAAKVHNIKTLEWLHDNGFYCRPDILQMFINDVGYISIGPQKDDVKDWLLKKGLVDRTLSYHSSLLYGLQWLERNKLLIDIQRSRDRIGASIHFSDVVEWLCEYEKRHSQQQQ